MNTASKQSTKTHYEADAREELIDTYELFTGISKKFGEPYSCTFKFDSALPLIYGKPLIVRHLFSQFLSENLNTLTVGETKNEVLISYTKDRLYWVFTLQIQSKARTPEPIQKLMIHKGAIQNFYSNSHYQLNAH